MTSAWIGVVALPAGGRSPLIVDRVVVREARNAAFTPHPARRYRTIRGLRAILDMPDDAALTRTECHAFAFRKDEA